MVFFIILYRITVWPVAHQFILWGGPGPRFEPGPGGPEAGTLYPRPPHLLKIRIEYVLSLKSRMLRLPNIWRDRHWVATKLRSNPEEKANSLYVLQKLWMKLKLKIFNHTVHCTKVLRMQPKKKSIWFQTQPPKKLVRCFTLYL